MGHVLNGRFSAKDVSDILGFEMHTNTTESINRRRKYCLKLEVNDLDAKIINFVNGNTLRPM